MGMPRVRRSVQPGSLVHVIVRFLNRQFFLRTDIERQEYLLRAGKAFGGSDWRVVSYALMSSHVHFAAIAGCTRFADIGRPLHVGFAAWLNRRLGRLGPVVATRPATYAVEMNGAGRLIAYHHNNPVRANVVRFARDSAWTSHRMYLGKQPSLPWVDVERGLEMAGFGRCAHSRNLFDEFVNALADAEMANFQTNLLEIRKKIRRELGSTVEISHPVVNERGDVKSIPIWALQYSALQTPWDGNLEVVVKQVAKQLHIDISELYSRTRRRRIVRGRRIAILCTRVFLRRPLGEIAAHLGVSREAARKLECTATDVDRDDAKTVAQIVLAIP